MRSSSRRGDHGECSPPPLIAAIYCHPRSRRVTINSFCDHCDDGMSYHDEQEEVAWVSFRDAVDAEEAAELARIRKKLKLTQREAAKIAGGGHNAFSRYERGEVKPGQAVLNLFRLLDHHPDLLKEIRSCK